GRAPHLLAPELRLVEGVLGGKAERDLSGPDPRELTLREQRMEHRMRLADAREKARPPHLLGRGAIVARGAGAFRTSARRRLGGEDPRGGLCKARGDVLVARRRRLVVRRQGCLPPWW